MFTSLTLLFTVPWPQDKALCTSTGNVLRNTIVLSVSSTSSGSLKSGIDILLGTSNWGIRSGYVQVLLKLQGIAETVLLPGGTLHHENSAYFHTFSCFLRSHKNKLKGRVGPKTDHLLSGFLEGFGAGLWRICWANLHDFRWGFLWCPSLISSCHPLSPLYSSLAHCGSSPLPRFLSCCTKEW